MDYNRPGDFVDVFIRCCFAEEDGWTLLEGLSAEYRNLEYIFQRLDGEEVLISRIPDPIVTAHSIRLASELATARTRSKHTGSANAIIVCGQLLMQPSKTPENVKVISIVEDIQGKHESQTAFVSHN